MVSASWEELTPFPRNVASFRAQVVKNPPACRRPGFDPRVGKISWRKERLPTPVFWPGKFHGLYSSISGSGISTGEGIGYPLQYSWTSLVAQLVKESACSTGGLGLIPGLGRSPGEGKGYLLQYSDLEDSMNCIVHVVAKSQTWLSNFHFTSLPQKHSARE